MAVNHNKPHAQARKNDDPRIHGPYLDDIRAAEEQNRRDARQKARDLSKKAAKAGKKKSDDKSDSE